MLSRKWKLVSLLLVSQILVSSVSHAATTIEIDGKSHVCFTKEKSVELFDIVSNKFPGCERKMSIMNLQLDTTDKTLEKMRVDFDDLAKLNESNGLLLEELSVENATLSRRAQMRDWLFFGAGSVGTMIVFAIVVGLRG